MRWKRVSDDSDTAAGDTVTGIAASARYTTATATTDRLSADRFTTRTTPTVLLSYRTTGDATKPHQSDPNTEPGDASRQAFFTDILPTNNAQILKPIRLRILKGKTMKTQILRLAGMAVVLMSMTQPIMAGSPAISVLQQTGDAHCQHVIDLLMRYGMSKHARLTAVPFGNSLILGDSVGDLELVSVTLVDPGNDAAGPTMAIAVRNNSERHVCSFSVSAVAVLGRIHPFSPSTTSTIKKICAGETLEIQLQLPIEALAMGRVGTNVMAFKKLVVAIDSFDELLECDESNNILILDRTEIPAAAPVVVEETVTSPQTATPAPRAGLAPETQQVPNETQPSPSDPTEKPSPSIDDIDFDKLEVIEK